MSGLQTEGLNLTRVPIAETGMLIRRRVADVFDADRPHRLAGLRLKGGSFCGRFAQPSDLLHCVVSRVRGRARKD